MPVDPTSFTPPDIELGVLSSQSPQPTKTETATNATAIQIFDNQAKSSSESYPIKSLLTVGALTVLAAVGTGLAAKAAAEEEFDFSGMTGFAKAGAMWGATIGCGLVTALTPVAGYYEEMYESSNNNLTKCAEFTAKFFGYGILTVAMTTVGGANDGAKVGLLAGLTVKGAHSIGVTEVFTAPLTGCGEAVQTLASSCFSSLSNCASTLWDAINE